MFIFCEYTFFRLKSSNTKRRRQIKVINMANSKGFSMSDKVEGPAYGQSSSSGLTGCGKGMTDFLSLSLDNAFLISVEHRHIQVILWYTSIRVY